MLRFFVYKIALDMGINILCHAACGMAEQILLYFRGNARLYQPCGIGLAQDMCGNMKDEQKRNAAQRRTHITVSVAQIWILTFY